MRQDFDFHIHSKNSDGEFSVEHIVKLLEVLKINKLIKHPEETLWMFFIFRRFGCFWKNQKEKYLFFL